MTSGSYPGPTVEAVPETVESLESELKSLQKEVEDAAPVVASATSALNCICVSDISEVGPS
jgi:hypothetical protein